MNTFVVTISLLAREMLRQLEGAHAQLYPDRKLIPGDPPAQSTQVEWCIGLDGIGSFVDLHDRIRKACPHVVRMVGPWDRWYEPPVARRGIEWNGCEWATVRDPSEGMALRVRIIDRMAVFDCFGMSEVEEAFRLASFGVGVQ